MGICILKVSRRGVVPRGKNAQGWCPIFDRSRVPVYRPSARAFPCTARAPELFLRLSMIAMAATAAATARRLFLSSTGGLTCFAAYKSKLDPPHLIWDLDNTILCSICPHPEDVANADDDQIKNDSSDRYFDQIDDDFPYDGDRPNTRTYWRPGARTALRFTGLFGIQHVFTTAQKTYTDNVLRELDPNREIFHTVMHRDISPASVKNGKDLSLITDRLDRALLFDDKLKNFNPQKGKNGVKVKLFDEEAVRGSDIEEMMEVARLVGISFLALLSRDVRDILPYFQSEDHAKKYSLDTEKDKNA